MKKATPTESPKKPKEDKNAVEPATPVEGTSPLPRKEEEKRERAPTQQERAQPERAAAASNQTTARARNDPAKDAELKQRQKQDKLKKQEEKRRKERQIAQRQKEREERQAEQQRQREEEEAERAKAAAHAAKKRQQEEEIKAKYAKRVSEMQRMMRQSRTTQLGEQFLLELGAQKGGNAAADAKLASKQASITKQRSLVPAPAGKKSTEPDEAENAPARSKEGSPAKGKPKAQKSGPTRAALRSVTQKIPEEPESADSSRSSEGFVNPFEFLKKAKRGNTMSPEAFEKMLQPKVVALQAALKDELDKVYKQIEDTKKSWSASLGSTEQQMHEKVATVASGLEATRQELKRQAEVNAAQQQRLTYDMEDTKQRLDLETQEIQKLRVGVKKDIATELAKITSDDVRTKYELRRLNALIANISETTDLLAEDQMLNQLIQEQEALDKKQTALFGLKKHSQILGTNQYAMQNNLLSTT